MEIVTESAPTKKTPGISDFTGELYKTCKDDNNTCLYKLFQNTKEEKKTQRLV